MKLRLRSLLLPLAFATALPVAGCQQGIGDRCQLDSDCANNCAGNSNSTGCTHCVLPPGGTAQQGGTCQGSSVTATDDMGNTVVRDLSVVTPPPDMTMTGNLSTVGDLASPDLSSPDLATPPADAASVDGGG